MAEENMLCKKAVLYGFEEASVPRISTRVYAVIESEQK